MNCKSPIIPVLIIGAGASGIAMGCKLQRKYGFGDYTIFEKQSEIGGAWTSNKYPGIACDVPMALYSFSFAPKFTSKSIYPSGAEYLEYLQDVARSHGVDSKIQFNTEVTDLQYLEESSTWQVTISRLVPHDHKSTSSQESSSNSGILKTEKILANVVISCVGILVKPNVWPSSVPGNETFEGEIIHSSHLTDSVNMHDKKVVVIGSGCSAAQIVPTLLQRDEIASLTQIMRTPPWVEPRLEEPLGKAMYSRYAPNLFRYMQPLGWIFRVFIYIYTEIEWATIFQRRSTFLRGLAEKAATKHMKAKAPEKYHAVMTPKYSYGCKRRVFDSSWLESMRNPKFSLTTSSLTSLGPDSVYVRQDSALTGEGSTKVHPDRNDQIQADIIILANGFQATKFLHAISVHGRGDLTLHTEWKNRGGEQAYLGTAMDKFPNLFFVIGPNTFVGHSSVIISIENTVDLILKIMKPIIKGKSRTVEVKKEAVVKWTADIQNALCGTVFSGCKSWYSNERGWNSVIYPRSQIDFWYRCKFPIYEDWTYT
ncbi:FAD/NAD(P)-binding protein [Glarea lozoyensis ATCC 20868]|uniref:FAD/NAD(P)-binding protein n=1 Tax=Glarea lozoyensis (strain ATCC 20868 / MF5171) TaxID=1116229 RepID=S3CMM4_GLAL2|nr:FAD/NAD(P)-binding protein [Glarea lozoyensis ATCC 20868]EPE26980.1 FAD/NAD(P)-binding protein [Glarea lozoyensis ATCC 20868]